MCICLTAMISNQNNLFGSISSADNPPRSLRGVRIFRPLGSNPAEGPFLYHVRACLRLKPRTAYSGIQKGSLATRYSCCESVRFGLKTIGRIVA